jgi:copper homeostasis protein (lipoprotein)
VDNNIALESGYANARKAAGEPVFLTFEGYFSIQPSMEEGQMEKAVVPETKIAFDDSKNCDSQ